MFLGGLCALAALFILTLPAVHRRVARLFDYGPALRQLVHAAPAPAAEAEQSARPARHEPRRRPEDVEPTGDAAGQRTLVHPEFTVLYRFPAREEYGALCIVGSVRNTGSRAIHRLVVQAELPGQGSPWRDNLVLISSRPVAPGGSVRFTVNLRNTPPDWNPERVHLRLMVLEVAH